MLGLTVHTRRFPTEPEGDLDHCNGMPGSAFVQFLVDLLRPHIDSVDELIQEDYGWGAYCKKEGFRIWVTVSYATSDEDPGDDIPEWGVLVNHEAGFSIRQWLRLGKGRQVEMEMFNRIQEALTSDPTISVTPDQ